MNNDESIQFFDEIEIVDQRDPAQVARRNDGLGADAAAQIIEPEIVDTETATRGGQSCAACGAPIDAADKFCHGCGTQNESGPADVADQLSERKYVQCKNCGSTITTDPNQRSYRCGFCDSTVVVEYSPEKTGRQNPEFIIGFGVSPEQAQEKFRHWIAKNRWWNPGDLKGVSLPEKMTGIYLPFWSFSMLAESQWNASIGEHWYRTETYRTRDAKGKSVTRTRTVTETEWWPLSGHFHHYYSGHLVSASTGLPQNIATQVMPFDLPALKRYEPYFLAGWENEEYTVERETALEVSQKYYHQCQESNVARFMPGDKHRRLEVSTFFSEINSDLCLLPYYLLTYRYEDKLYRFMINGQNGRVWGNKPVSKTRIGIFVGGLLLLLLLIVLIVVVLGTVFGSIG